MDQNQSHPPIPPNRFTQAQTIGRRAEDLAYYFLNQSGYELVARNYRCRGGEIDLVMRQNDILHFVEVKARRSFRFGRPEEAVDGLKRRRLFRASKSFLYEHPSWKEKCGYFLFDVMEVDLVRRALHWIPDAFSMEGEE